MTFTDPDSLPQYEQLSEEVRSYIDDLWCALTTRTVLGQATGLLAAQANVTVDEGFELLRVLSNLSNVRISVVAQVLVDARNGGPSIIDPTTIARVSSRLDEAAQRVKNLRSVIPHEQGEQEHQREAQTRSHPGPDRIPSSSQR